MAQPKTYLKVVLILALAGTLFAGYLTLNKLITGTCAFNESCPYFLGYPACWYGLALFLAILITSAMGLYGKLAIRKAAKVIIAVSSVGIIFAGSFVWQEISRWFTAGSTSYGLVLPTCVYGLVFYIALLITSVLFFRKSRETNNDEKNQKF